ncbi:MAG: hypothetical protein ACI8RZ_004985 [Myxococcota bacterium]|jgi:hypothetical protein
MNARNLLLGGVMTSVLQGCFLMEWQCFVAGTRILTPDGPRPIEDLEVGDLVFSFNTETGERVIRPVIKLLRSDADAAWEVKAGGSVIAGVTDDHPFYDVTAGAFRPVVELSQKSRVLLHSGEGSLDPVPLTRRRIPGAVAVYNLSIGGEEQNYFAEGILVHNKSPWDSGEDDEDDTNTQYEKEDTSLGVSVEWHSTSVNVTLTNGVAGYFGLVETGCLENCWLGEDCIYGDVTKTYFYCHPTNQDGVSLLYGGAAESLKVGAETVFSDSHFDILTTYYVEQGSACYVWGHDTSYYVGLGCTEL